MQSAGLSLLTKSYFEDLMYGRATSRLWGPLLTVFSWGYAIALKVRLVLYALHILKRNALPCPVISIGNITLGGTGKTPTVIQIGRLLLQAQRRPVIISRGYGRENEAETVVVSDGRSLLVDSQTGGDEPVLIGSKTLGAPVVVGANRHQAALDALRRFSPDVVILDDGYQHIQLKRTLDIVLVDASDPFGNGKLFPAGILREPLTALKRAHAVLITKDEHADDVERLRKIIATHTSGRIFTSRFMPISVVNCCTGETQSLSCLIGSNVLALSGIARPASFISLLASLGASVLVESIYPDHYAFKKQDLADVYRKAIDFKVNVIITTEKDAIRLKHLEPKGIYALRVELSVNEREEWERMILEQRA